MPKRKTSDKNFIELQKEIDSEKFLENVKSNFKDFPDPRIGSRCYYPMWYLFLVILSGYLAGCDTVADIAHFAELRGIRSERVIGDKIEVATRYYGSSRKAEARMFVIWIRGHWAIENALHYVMDVVFREDAPLSDVGYIPK